MNFGQWLRWKFMPATITHSIDGTLYYIEWGNRHPRHWLSVAAYPGPVPDDKKHGQLDGYVQITKDTGEVYHRRALPFVFWDVKSARDPAYIDKSSDLFNDYAAFEQWSI